MLCCFVQGLWCFVCDSCVNLCTGDLLHIPLFVWNLRILFCIYLCMYEWMCQISFILNLLCILFLFYQHTNFITCNTSYIMLSYIIYSPLFAAVQCIYQILHTEFNLYWSKLLCTSCMLYISSDSHLLTTHPSLFRLNQFLKIKKKILLVIKETPRHTYRAWQYGKQSLPATLATLPSQQHNYAPSIRARL